jgi:hypothetical protein
MTFRAAFGLAVFAITLVRHSYAQDNATLEVDGGRIEVNFASTPAPEFRKLVLAWVDTAARAVAGYYQKFPVSKLRLRIKTSDGRGVHGGQTFGWNGPQIKISVGNASTAADFTDDWMLTHEMIHLAFPSVAEEHHWIEEGLSTYVEPVARARIDQLTAAKVWRDWIESMPKGLPESGDRGLDHTPTWGRTYWGGALFCLLADIEIRKRTNNTKGLEDALRAILYAGGTIESDWHLTKALRIGDNATGVPVLSELYEKMKAAPAPVDLESMWKQLGVEQKAGRIEFDDNAPLAAIRRAITKS